MNEEYLRLSGTERISLWTSINPFDVSLLSYKGELENVGRVFIRGVFCITQNFTDFARFSGSLVKTRASVIVLSHRGVEIDSWISC